MRVFLFDLDGTLIDHFGAIHRTYVHALGQMGLPPPTAAQVRAAVGGGIRNSFAKFAPPERLEEGLAIYREFWDRTMLEGVELMPGARELLEQLAARGATLAVITNKLGSSSRLICDHLGITPLLQAVVGAQDTEWLKPAPEFTRHVLALLNARPDESLLIGDSPYDIQAAHAGGLPAWCVTTGTHSHAELTAAGADRIFANFAEMSQVI